jgi:alanine dehydrogenase
MSEVAGRLATQVGARFLEKENGGRGILLGGATGAVPGKIVVLGSGTVGTNAALIGLGIGARVVMMGRNLTKLSDRKKNLGEMLLTVEASGDNIGREIIDADLLVGAVLVPGGRAPRLVTRAMVAAMANDSVIVDVAIDQGGCVETSRPTTHSKPIFREEGVIHYCVANMPGAVPRTSTYALTNATLPYVARIADSGLEAAARSDQAISKGVNVYKGKLTNQLVAAAQDRHWTDIVELWER